MSVGSDYDKVINDIISKLVLHGITVVVSDDCLGTLSHKLMNYYNCNCVM
jgi:hypothetical protein